MITTTVQHAIDIVAGMIITGLIGSIIGRWKGNKSIKNGLVALLHDRLFYGCEYYLNKGWVTERALKNLAYMYKPYHNLGGNDICTELYERVKDLPIKSLEDIM